MAHPKNWPPQLPYLTTPIYSPHIPASTLTALRTKPPTPNTSTSAHEIPTIDIAKGPSPIVKITPIPSTNSTHPAAGQSGLFATKDLKPGTFILPYIGYMHISAPAEVASGTGGASETGGAASKRSASPSHEESDYDLSLDRELGIGIDAARMGNEARFVNDYRGVRGGPNAEFREVWDGRRGERGIGVWVLSEGKARGAGRKGGKGDGRERGIRKGEEILVSYGRGFWGARREG